MSSLQRFLSKEIGCGCTMQEVPAVVKPIQFEWTLKETCLLQVVSTQESHSGISPIIQQVPRIHSLQKPTIKGTQQHGNGHYS